MRAPAKQDARCNLLLRMTNRYPVAFAGFSAFERSALASTFRLSVHRQPAYLQAATLAEGQFILADADHPGVVEEVVAAGRAGQAVFIGSQAPKGAAAWMMRPIDPSHVLRELDTLVARQGVANTGMVGPYSLPVGGARGPVRPAQGEGPGRRATDSGFGADALPAAGDGAAQGQQAPAVREALIVDDSEIALRLLELRLVGLGLRTRFATSSQQALKVLSKRPADFVFLDINLGPESEIDGLALCRHIRHLPTPPGRSTPVLVIVSANHSEADRVRGSLAGCDAFIGKPLDDLTLKRVLALHGVLMAEANRLGATAA
jgi:CheY-like chemotaxis protein